MFGHLGFKRQQYRTNEARGHIRLIVDDSATPAVLVVEGGRCWESRAPTWGEGLSGLENLLLAG